MRGERERTRDLGEKKKRGPEARPTAGGFGQAYIGGFDSAGPAREEKQQEKEKQRSRMKEEEKEKAREKEREEPESVCLTVARLAAQPLLPVSLFPSLPPKPSSSRS